MLGNVSLNVFSVFELKEFIQDCLTDARVQRGVFSCVAKENALTKTLFILNP